MKIGIAMLSLLLCSMTPVTQSDMVKGSATAYVLTGTTATGTQTRAGICATGRKEWIGKTIVLYQRNGDEVGEIIGIYECEDTGCKSNVIDVWCDGMEEAQAFMDKVYENGCHGKVYIQVLEADG